jgi:hypothetical protein
MVSKRNYRGIIAKRLKSLILSAQMKIVRSNLSTKTLWLTFQTASMKWVSWPSCVCLPRSKSKRMISLSLRRFRCNRISIITGRISRPMLRIGSSHLRISLRKTSNSWKVWICSKTILTRRNDFKRMPLIDHSTQAPAHRLGTTQALSRDQADQMIRIQMSRKVYHRARAFRIVAMKEARCQLFSQSLDLVHLPLRSQSRAIEICQETLIWILRIQYKTSLTEANQWTSTFKRDTVSFLASNPKLLLQG